MNWPLHLALLAAIALAAGAMVRTPRALFTEAAGDPPKRDVEWRLTAGLAILGLAVFEIMTNLSPAGRLALSLCALALAAIVFADLSYLVIPDLYSGVLACLALLAPWRLPPLDAGIGAMACGGLLLALALTWRRLRGVDGLGFGDVKLAAAAGGLLGAEAGLMAISLSAAITALLIYGLRMSKRVEAGQLIPYGAGLSLAAGGFLAARLF